MEKSPLPAFLRASTLHVGAAAAAASLRNDLVNDHRLEAGDIDAAYAVSRVTPGTNLLALYALLGHRLGGWRLALTAVAVGALVPATIAVLIAAVYTHSSSAFVGAVMTGARAGGVAVFLGAAIRLLKPQTAAHPLAGAIIAVSAFVLAWVSPVSPFLVLLIAGAIGTMVLRPAP